MTSPRADVIQNLLWKTNILPLLGIWLVILLSIFSIWRSIRRSTRAKVVSAEEGVQIGPLVLRDADRVRHTHIVGSSGAGKTEAAKILIFEDIRRGRGCFIIDPKGDRELYEEIRGYCAVVGRSEDLKLISATYPNESCVWNPCGLGNPSELQSKFYNANVYSEPYYAKACETALIRSFNQLTKDKPEGFGLKDLTASLKAIAAADKSKAIDGLFFDFESIAQSEWANILGCDPAFAREREISFLDVIRNNQILFLDLPTEGKSLQSSRLGRLFTQELILISGMRKSCPTLLSAGNPNHAGVFSVYIDEFDAFATESFVTFLNKARSSGFMIHVLHQTLSDLKKISPEFMGQLLGLFNVHLIGIQHDPDDAELWARFIGTHTVIKQTYQTAGLFNLRTGVCSNRETQEFIVSPGIIKRLGVGEFVASVKTQDIREIVRLALPRRYGSEAADQTKELMSGRVRGLASSGKKKSKWEMVLAPAGESMGGSNERNML